MYIQTLYRSAYIGYTSSFGQFQIDDPWFEFRDSNTVDQKTPFVLCLYSINVLYNKHLNHEIIDTNLSNDILPITDILNYAYLDYEPR